MTSGEFLERLVIYCSLLDASVTSYGRTVQHNHAVGGVTFSAHQAWRAADVVYDVAIAIETRREWARRLGLVLVVEDDHDHLQAGDWKAG